MGSTSKAPHLNEPRVQALRLHLETLLEDLEATPLLARDPLRFVRRYPQAPDQEVAGLFSSALAFGNVVAFGAVLEQLFAQLDAAGGPRSWLDGLDSTAEEKLLALQYRWIRGTHLVTLARALRGMVHHHGTLGAAFISAHRPEHPHLGPALVEVSHELRTRARNDAGTPLPRGVRHLLPSPSGGSACKRWNLLLRWMVRRPGPGVTGLDLGAWPLPTEKLIIPLDTHVGRVSRFLGLTHRSDGSWRTAMQITQNLRKIHPSDPTRYDFALAHLGISGACQARRIPQVCDPCALGPVCSIGSPRRSAGG